MRAPVVVFNYAGIGGHGDNDVSRTGRACQRAGTIAQAWCVNTAGGVVPRAVEQWQMQRREQPQERQRLSGAGPKTGWRNQKCKSEWTRRAAARATTVLRMRPGREPTTRLATRVRVNHECCQQLFRTRPGTNGFLGRSKRQGSHRSRPAWVSTLIMMRVAVFRFRYCGRTAQYSGHFCMLPN
jgi:hypothetical protein